MKQQLQSNLSCKINICYCIVFILSSGQRQFATFHISRHLRGQPSCAGPPWRRLSIQDDFTYRVLGVLQLAGAGEGYGVLHRRKRRQFECAHVGIRNS